MKDPRLVEIEFLVEADSVDTVILQSSADSHFAQVGSLQTTYGLDARRFRDLVVDMLLSAALQPPPLGRAPGLGSHDFEMANDRTNALKSFTGGFPVTVSITHAGRVQLWELRDDLLRNPDVEPMGLLSKAAWERALPVQLQFVAEDAPLSMVFIDLDDFGKVNKEISSVVGDEVLRAAFQIIRNVVGARGLAYRFGGEEVGVLLPRMGNGEALALGEELRAMLESGVRERVERLGRVQTASIGVATFSTRLDVAAAVERADGAMRRAKQAGKNRVVGE